MGEQPQPQDDELKQPHATGKLKPDWTSQIDAELAFRLIDSILPFEACLYHQILPLSLEGSRLKLGMVNPDDTAALDYVRRILAYMNCSLVPQPLSSEVHYSALTAYLNYADSQKKAANPASQPVARRIARKLAEQSGKKASETKDSSLDANSNPTLLVDSPTEIPLLEVEATAPRSPQPSVSKAGGEQVSSSDSIALVDAPPILNIAPQHLTDPPEVLASLPPNALLHELLARILSWGIGRLYLERQADHGRILWSQSGVLQAVLEELPIDLFQGVISELKLLTQLPLLTVQKPKQIEVERLYQNHRLLLRLRLMPGRYGEEATLQVLRGAALKFYQQQQLVNLGQEALALAQQLQQKVSEVYAHSCDQSVKLPEHLSIVPELDRTLKRIGHLLGELQVLKVDEAEED